MSNFFENFTSGFVAFLTVIFEHLWATPWQWDAIKAKALLNGFAIIVWLLLLARFGWNIYTKYVTKANEWEEPNWSTLEIVANAWLLLGGLGCLLSFIGRLYGNFVTYFM